jgi:hypothetical protein
MGLGNRNKAASPDPGGPQQIPDDLAQRAQIAYGSADFVRAAELFSEAVDKLHTMYAVGNCTYRQPSEADAAITQGLVSAVGAAIAAEHGLAVRQYAEQSISYLSEIARLPQAEPVVILYDTAVTQLSRLLR